MEEQIYETQIEEVLEPTQEVIEETTEIIEGVKKGLSTSAKVGIVGGVVLGVGTTLAIHYYKKNKKSGVKMKFAPRLFKKIDEEEE